MFYLFYGKEGEAKAYKPDARVIANLDSITDVNLIEMKSLGDNDDVIVLIKEPFTLQEAPRPWVVIQQPPAPQTRLHTTLNDVAMGKISPMVAADRIYALYIPHDEWIRQWRLWLENNLWALRSMVAHQDLWLYPEFSLALMDLLSNIRARGLPNVK